MELIVRPREVVSWNDFRSNEEGNSIALDGYVKGKPKFSLEGPYANFNHHEEVDRLSTRSTCGQVMVAIKQGLIDAFRINGKLKLNVFVNDPDQDTCLAVWLLDNHERLIGCRSEPLISRMVFMSGLLDVTAGAYPFDTNTESMRQLAWVFEPYVNARITGRIFKMDEHEMHTVIEAVLDRISRHTLGKGEEVELDAKYEVLGGGDGWNLINEIGFYARSRLFKEVGAFVSLRGEDNGKYHYSIGKMAPYINFPILELYDHLNKMEGIDPNDIDRWGGGNIIGGSPRQRGSKFAPEELTQIINEFLKERRVIVL